MASVPIEFRNKETRRTIGRAQIRNLKLTALLKNLLTLMQKWNRDRDKDTPLITSVSVELSKKEMEILISFSRGPNVNLEVNRSYGKQEYGRKSADKILRGDLTRELEYRRRILKSP